MKEPIAKFYRFLDEPIFPTGRVLLGVTILFLILSYTQPLWRISMVAPQYPEGLSLDIFSYQVKGGHDNADLNEINTLNHYIGMHRIERSTLNDLDWLPFAFGILALLVMRVAAIGTVRSLIDVTVLIFYVSAFGLFRFYYKLYTFGHDLDPKAPFKMEPFTPAILGKKQIANFTTEAWPGLGTIYLGLFALGIVTILVWHLVAGRRRALRELPDAG